MNGVIYARFSSDHQREESIEGQIRICKDYAAKHGITIINEYVDRAISGKTDKRPAFQKMIADSETKLFQVVIVYALDRFARNGKQSAIYENILNLNGVQLQSATENINGAPSSIILKAVLQGVAEYYSAELATKITRGMTENALKGKWTSGIIPFGYTRDENKYLIPHPINAAYVQEIFKLFLQDTRLVDIAAYLNDHGIRTSYGTEFNKSSFHSILTNRIYIGEFRWKNVVKENSVPALVDLDLFLKVQKLLEIRKRTKMKARTSDTYLLPPKIFCAHCNGPMVGMCGTSKTKDRHYYYICSNKHRNKSCDMPNISKVDVESILIKYLTDLLSKKENITAIARNAMSAQNLEQESEEMARLQSQKKELQKKVDNCLTAIEKGIMSDALTNRLKESESALQLIQTKIAEQSVNLHAAMLSEAQIVFFLTKMGEDLKESTDTSIRAVIRSLVRAVFVEYKKDSDEYIITAQFNYATTNSINSIEEFRVRKKDTMVNHNREVTNPSIIYYSNYFEFSIALPRRKSQRPAM